MGHIMKRLMVLGILVSGMSTSSAFAGMATGDQIKTAISGNSVQGNMDASGAYFEFNAADGTVFGKDYKAQGRGTVVAGNPNNFE